MASKGKEKVGKGKYSGDVDQIQRKSTKQYEGALDNSFYILGQMKSKQWHKARIIDCRLAKDYDPKKQKSDTSYEYYIHYEGVNRRMDEWVQRNRIQVQDEEIFDEPIPKKKKKAEDKKMEERVENDEHEGIDDASLAAHNEVTKFKTIDSIQLGKFSCETWYYSPYPEGFHNIECLYICEFCLSFYVTQNELKRHAEKCPINHPPGNQIYFDDSQQQHLSMFEIDGFLNGIFCENLCFLSKLFLDHKNLYWNMDPFLFYILCEVDANGHHIVGYFSKEKENSDCYNLSCILTFPFHQRRGFGKFLITMSYELSIIEGKLGTPERPLSDMGNVSYKSFWVQRIIDYIRTLPKDTQFSINDISKYTHMKENDIVWTLEQKNLLKYAQGLMIICTDTEYLDKVYKEAGRSCQPIIRSKIKWIPYKLKWDKEYNFNLESGKNAKSNKISNL